MAFWRKKRDVIDLTRLQKQGVLDKVNAMNQGQEIGQESSEGFVDMSASSGYGSYGSPSVSSSSSGEDEGVSALAALGALASAGITGASESSKDVSSGSGSSWESDSSSVSSGSYTDRLKDARSVKLTDLHEVRHKVEDMEYKLDRLIERIAKLEEGS